MRCSPNNIEGFSHQQQQIDQQPNTLEENTNTTASLQQMSNTNLQSSYELHQLKASIDPLSQNYQTSSNSSCSSSSGSMMSTSSSLKLPIIQGTLMAQQQQASAVDMTCQTQQQQQQNQQLQQLDEDDYVEHDMDDESDSSCDEADDDDSNTFSDSAGGSDSDSDNFGKKTDVRFGELFFLFFERL